VRADSRSRTGAAACASLWLLVGCGLTPSREERRTGSAEPIPPIDIAAIPDAVPRAEPRSRYGNPPFYQVFGKRYYVMSDAAGHVETGLASWYGPGFHAETTASGEPYDMYAMTAAHKTLPLPAYVRVTNLENGRSIVVRVNDRGPFVDGRIIDLSYTAAAKLDIVRAGTARVEMRVLDAAGGAGARPAIAPSAGPPRAAVPSASPPTLAQVLPGGAAPLFIQAGAFGDRANADKLASRLVAAGIELTRIETDIVGGRTLHRVRIGPIGSVEDFDRTMAKLAEVGVPNARLASD
jgi:rare lipoprotein A